MIWCERSPDLHPWKFLLVFRFFALDNGSLTWLPFLPLLAPSAPEWLPDRHGAPFQQLGPPTHFCIGFSHWHTAVTLVNYE